MVESKPSYPLKEDPAFLSLICSKNTYIFQIKASILELEALKESLDSKLNKIKISNTLGNAASITGTVLLFTPLFLFGIGTLGAGMATSVGSSIGGYIIEKKNRKKLIIVLENEEAGALEYSNKVKDVMNSSSTGLVLFFSRKNSKNASDEENKLQVAFNGVNGAVNLFKAGTGLTTITQFTGGVGIMVSVADIVMTWKVDNETSVRISRMIEEKIYLLNEQREELAELKHLAT